MPPASRSPPFPVPCTAAVGRQGASRDAADNDVQTRPSICSALDRSRRRGSAAGRIDPGAAGGQRHVDGGFPAHLHNCLGALPLFGFRCCHLNPPTHSRRSVARGEEEPEGDRSGGASWRRLSSCSKSLVPCDPPIPIPTRLHPLAPAQATRGGQDGGGVA